MVGHWVATKVVLRVERWDGPSGTASVDRRVDLKAERRGAMKAVVMVAW